MGSGSRESEGGGEGPRSVRELEKWGVRGVEGGAGTRLRGVRCGALGRRRGSQGWGSEDGLGTDVSWEEYAVDGEGGPARVSYGMCRERGSLERQPESEARQAAVCGA